MPPLSVSTRDRGSDSHRVRNARISRMTEPALDHDTDRTLSALFRDRTATVPDNLFAIFPDATVTYGELLARASAFGRGLLALGLEPGDHVAILMPNCLDFLVAHYGVQLAGGKSILLNARFKQHELAVVV